MTVKSPLLVASSPGACTVIGPVVAPSGTVAVTIPLKEELNSVAAVPLNETPVAPAKRVARDRHDVANVTARGIEAGDRRGGRERGRITVGEEPEQAGAGWAAREHGTGNDGPSGTIDDDRAARGRGQLRGW